MPSFKAQLSPNGLANRGGIRSGGVPPLEPPHGIRSLLAVPLGEFPDPVDVADGVDQEDRVRAECIDRPPVATDG